MGDRDRSPAARQRIEGALDADLRGRIDRRGGLVEDEEVGVGEVGARERDELAFPGGQRLPTLAHLRLQSLRQTGRPLGKAEFAQGAGDLGTTGRGTEPDVVGDRRVEEEALLRHQDHALAQRGEPHRPQVVAVEAHDAGGRIHQAGHELGESRLARSRLPNDGDSPAGGDVRGDVAQDEVALGIGEVDVVEVDGHRATRQVNALVAGVGDIGRGVDDLDDSAPSGDGILEFVEVLRRHLHRLGEQADQEQEGQQLPQRHPAAGRQRRADDKDDGQGDPGDKLPGRKGDGGANVRLGGRPPVLLDRDPDPLGGAILHPEAADRRGPDDALGHRSQQVTDALAHLAVGEAERALQSAHDDEQRDEASPGHGREDWAVVRHQRGRQQDLAEGDQQDDAAELHELADGVDVGGDARDHRAATLRTLSQHRQVAQVPEGGDAQGGQARLRGPEQAHIEQVGRA